MKREIKFRAWDKKKQKFIKSFAITNIGYLMVQRGMTFEDTAKYGIENVEIMQFTGLKDKNGNEIYESDLIYLSETNKDKALEVFFKNGSFCTFDVNGKDLCYLGDNIFKNDFIIIGNIYENK